MGTSAILKFSGNAAIKKQLISSPSSSGASQSQACKTSWMSKMVLWFDFGIKRAFQFLICSSLLGLLLIRKQVCLAYVGFCRLSALISESSWMLFALVNTH